MANFKQIAVLMASSGALLTLVACGGDSTAELANPGNTGSNPGISTSSTTSTTSSSGGVVTANCPAQTTAVAVGTETHCRLPARINTNLTLIAGNIYQMNARFDVGTDTSVAGGGAAAVLTVLPGTTIYASNQNAYLVVNKGSQIIADGNVSQPIIFTSAADLDYDDDVNVNNRAASPAVPTIPERASFRGVTTADTNGTTTGEWGGLVLNGFAPTNNPTRIGEGSTGVISGGTNAADNSGILRYVQIRYAGFDVGVATGGAVGVNELNGVAFQAVGNGTLVDFVQVHQGFDDCFEFFGGTVDVRHVICDGTSDDAFDWTDGYVGRAQFFLHVQNPNNVTGDACIEADNLAANETTPRSNPVIANFTCLGSFGATGVTGNGGTTRFRVGTAVRFLNAVISRARVGAFDIDGASSYTQLTNGTTVLRSLYITSDIPFGTAAEDTTQGLPALFAAGAGNLASNNAASTLQSQVAGGVRYVNGTGETARPAFAISNTTIPGAGTFFQAAPYVGAVPSTSANWTIGWTEFLNRGA